jgi:hypothetical protein
VKKREGSDVLETVIKSSSKTQKENGRTYKFSKTHQTSKVAFYDFNPYEDVKNLLVEVPIDKLVSNSYGLNYAEYMKDDSAEDKYEEGVIVKTLGEVCKFLPKSKRQASYGNSEGKYPFYTSSQSCTKYCDEYDYEEESLIIGTGGNANIKYSNKFSCSTDNFIIKINKEHLVKYIYYYLSLNIEILQKGFMGVGLQHISKEYINNIKIPIPSLEKQQEIVDFLDANNNRIKQLENEIKDNKKLAHQFIKGINKNIDIDEVEEKDEEVTTTPACHVSSSKSSSNASSKSSLVELKAQCKSLGIKKYSKLNKKQLIELIAKH